MPAEQLGTTIIIRAREGRTDEADWLVIESCLKGPIYRVARRLGLNHHDAEELVQDVLLKLWANIDKYTPDVPSVKSFQGWITACAARAAVDRIRKLCRRRRHEKPTGGSTNDRRMCVMEAREGTPVHEDEVLKLFTEEYLPDERDRAEKSLREAWGADLVMQVKSEFSATAWEAYLYCDVCKFHSCDVAPFLGQSADAVRQERKRVKQRIKDLRQAGVHAAPVGEAHQ